MKNILRNKLKALMIETFSMSPDFSCSDESIMPFQISMAGTKYFIYVKNITTDKFQGEDATRVQLPSRDVFKTIAESDTPFIFLGYDSENDVLVCWNPCGLKERLNNSNNVSLYSRQSIQNDVADDEFRIAYLRNGAKFILFKRDCLVDFFKQIDTLFSDETKETVKISRNITENKKVGGKITYIPDEDIKNEALSELKANRTLNAVVIVMNFYADQYPDMDITDWSPIVRSLVNSSNDK